MTNLDQWSNIPDNTCLILNDAHADYLYQTSHQKEVEDNYNYLIKRELAEEKLEEQKRMESHEKYVKSHYIRVGA